MVQTNLHSTMFLLILRRDRRKDYFLCIYIPLCFYLYSNLQSMATDRIQNLHSTMFLLIPRIMRSGSPGWLIYIPLCFYLYFARRGIMSSKSNLHSTMFLLIHKPEKTPEAQSSNLHSTMFLLIPKWRNGPLVWCPFTFHYVSTYTYHIRQSQVRQW